MDLYKIKNGKLKKFNGGFVVVDNRIYTNPTEETIRKAGYKELAEVTPPEVNDETEYVEITYVDGDVITPVYKVSQFEELVE